ncbi:MAG: LemA family protein [Anaerovoracaceae bacterium]|jgi:LemA protein
MKYLIPGIIILLIVLFITFVIGSYNGLVRLRQRVKNAWSQIEVQLKRRYDLIPNLVNTVKGYAQHESKTLEEVTKARNMAVNAGSIKDQIDADNMLTGALRSLFAVAEAYPDLKANSNFIQLQGELSDTENKIAFSRQFYNDTVQKFNTKIEVFPTNLIAGILGFTAADYFNLQDDPQASQAVKVEF